MGLWWCVSYETIPKITTIFIKKKQKNQKNMLKTTTKRSLEFGTTSVLAHARLVLLVELLTEGGVVGVLER